LNANSRLVVTTVVSLALFLLGLSLGQWQLGRAAQKEAMAAQRQTAQALTAVANEGALLDLAQANRMYRSVVLTGRWLPEHAHYLDNRSMDGRVGFILAAPFKLEPQGQVVLVQHGWQPRNFVNRLDVPPIRLPQGVVEITARLSPWPSQHFEMGGADAGLIRQNLHASDFGAIAGFVPQAVSFQTTSAAEDGLLRKWPMPGSGSDTNYGYAFQWFTLSGLVALYYVWFQIVKRKKSR
jgi:surfeit locus 1 family protein